LECNALIFEILKDYGLFCSGYASVLEGCLDAIWIIDKEDYTLMSGWVHLLSGRAIS